MSLDVRLNLKLQQRLVMTPNLQQAIKLLQLSKLELEDYIQQEMLENPMLEDNVYDDEDDRASNDKDEKNDKAEKDPDEKLTSAEEQKKDNEKADEEFDWDKYFDNGADYGSYTSSGESLGPVLYENFLSETENLEQHLCWQVQMSNLNEHERCLAYILVGNIDDDGYLHERIPEIAEREGVTVEELEAVLPTIQRMDPIGVGSRTLQECLLVQMDYYGIDDPIAIDLVTNHLQLLERKHYQDLARKLKINTRELKPILCMLETLEPKPGRKFPSGATHYVTPDVYVVKVDGELQVLMNDEGLPRLRVSRHYRKYLETDSDMEKESKSKPETMAEENDKETKDYLEKKMRSAMWLIKSVEQRKRTIFRVTESILRKQGEFFEKGVRHLKPMVLRDVAEDIGVHESTVSRVSTNKYLHCAQGVFELKYFFHSGISSDTGEDVSSLRIKEIIKEEISQEDSRKPLSDQKLANIIEDRIGVGIARRTVAKYRIDMNIPSSSQRKSL